MNDRTVQRRIIFVGGIHGVGKTTLCEFLRSKLNLLHYSASQLISKLEQIEFPANKYIVNIEENQDSLIFAINEYVNSDEGRLA